jgi:uncharacterized protein (TIGR03382 family)
MKHTPWAFLPFLLASSAHALSGDLRSPIAVADFPLVHAADTRSGIGQLKRYACSPDVILPGAETVYEISIETPGLLSAGLFGHQNQWPLHVHLLSDLTLNEDGIARGCVAGGEEGVEAEVQAGRYFIVIDHRKAGSETRPYALRIDFLQNNIWQIAPLAKGVELHRKREHLQGNPNQMLFALKVNLQEKGVSLRILHEEGCHKTSSLGAAQKAVAAINAGFFGAGCKSVSLVKKRGEMASANGKDRSAFAILNDGSAAIRLVPAGENWTDAAEAVGGVPRILSAGQVDLRTQEEGSFKGFEQTAHPRSAVGIGEDASVILFAANGRTTAGAGLTLNEVAHGLISLGATEGLNLDGGGSTTLWVNAMPFGGVLNHPSDNGRADHDGERAVSSAIGVFAPPLAPDPLWLNAKTSFEISRKGETPLDVLIGGMLRDEVVVEVEKGDFSGKVRLVDLGLNQIRLFFDGQGKAAKPGGFALALLMKPPDGRTKRLPFQLVMKEGDANGGLFDAMGCACNHQAGIGQSPPLAPFLVMALGWMWLRRRKTQRCLPQGKK